MILSKKISIIGATGYVAAEIVKMIYNHPNVLLGNLVSSSSNGKYMHEVLRNFTSYSDLMLSNNTFEDVICSSDLIFSALPHGKLVEYLDYEHLQNTKVIDLSADFRIQDEEIHKLWYGFNRYDTKLVRNAVYGLPELNRNAISNASFIANPGCFTTCSILSLVPFIKEGWIEMKGIIIDAKSGVSGAGRTPNFDIQYCEVNESIKAYKVAEHRHTPEIEEQIKQICNLKEFNLTFTPHLIPMNRGILTTIYADLKKEVNDNEIHNFLKNYYKDEHFVRVQPLGIYPETRWVKGSNFFDISIKVDKRTNRLIIISALDNLMKGAASQAVQNMNILFGWDERLGINNIPYFPI